MGWGKVCSVARNRQLIRRVQRGECALNFFVDLWLLDSALQDDRSIGGDEVGYLLERDDGFEAQAIVLALGVDFADVELLDPVAEALQNCPGFTHCRIDLARMADVEAQ